MRKRQFLRHRFSGSDTNRLLASHRQYEMWKEAWRANHPDATPEDYARAMKRIADELKI